MSLESLLNCHSTVLAFSYDFALFRFCSHTRQWYALFAKLCIAHIGGGSQVGLLCLLKTA